MPLIPENGNVQSRDPPHITVKILNCTIIKKQDISKQFFIMWHKIGTSKFSREWMELQTFKWRGFDIVSFACIPYMTATNFFYDINYSICTINKTPSFNLTYLIYWQCLKSTSLRLRYSINKNDITQYFYTWTFSTIALLTNLLL
jgi:hypothetical protein